MNYIYQPRMNSVITMEKNEHFPRPKYRSGLVAKGLSDFTLFPRKPVMKSRQMKGIQIRYITHNIVKAHGMTTPFELEPEVGPSRAPFRFRDANEGHVNRNNYRHDEEASWSDEVPLIARTSSLFHNDELNAVNTKRVEETEACSLSVLLAH